MGGSWAPNPPQDPPRASRTRSGPPGTRPGPTRDPPGPPWYPSRDPPGPPPGPPRDPPKILRISPGITATGSKTTTWLYKLHQPASQQARRQARQQASEQASTTVTQQASKQTNEPASQHARKQANKPASKHASKAGSRRTSERKAATTNSHQAFTIDMQSYHIPTS